MRLLADRTRHLIAAARRNDPVEAPFQLLQRPLTHREVLAKPLERLALAYLTQARLERINPFENLRPYDIQASIGVTVNYLFIRGTRGESRAIRQRRNPGREGPGIGSQSSKKSLAGPDDENRQTRTSHATASKNSVINSTHIQACS